MIKKVLSLFFMLTAASIAAAQKNPPPPPAPSAGAPVTAPTPSAAQAAPAAPHTFLKVGQPAPDFYLPSTIVGPDKKTVRYKLSDFRGKKNVVLAFYVFAFTGG